MKMEDIILSTHMLKTLKNGLKTHLHTQTENNDKCRKVITGHDKFLL